MTKSNQVYPTDLNDTQWLKIRPYLPAEAQTGHPREHGWRVILNGIFYILQSGCSWRMLPSDLPAWQTVYHYFRLWRKEGLWERLNQALRVKVGDNGTRKNLNPVPPLWIANRSRPRKEARNAVLTLARRSQAENGTLWWTLWAYS
jgi:transposase